MCSPYLNKPIRTERQAKEEIAINRVKVLGYSEAVTATLIGFIRGLLALDPDTPFKNLVLL